MSTTEYIVIGIPVVLFIVALIMILDEIDEDYKVQSPIDDLIGWVNKIQVAKTIFLNPTTRENCIKKGG